MQGQELHRRVLVKLTLSAVAFLLAGLALSTAIAKDQGDSASPQRVGINVPGIELDTRIAQIKSRAELNDYLTTHPGSENPLFPLTERNKKQFLESLVFTGKGLASFDANVLESSLTTSQIYHVLSLFGLQRAAHVFTGARIETDADRTVVGLAEADKFESNSLACPLLDGMACRIPATCYQSFNEVCVTCNCSKP